MGPEHEIARYYDLSLVVLSYLVALLASYTALDMSERLRKADRRGRWIWLAGSATVLGGGIWSMHFVAMLSFHVDRPVDYSVGRTLLSLLIAILFTGIGFDLVGQQTKSIPRLLAGGSVVGFGVAAMHYTGMAAMRVDAASVSYHRLLFALSVVIAVVAATAALWLAFNLHTAWQKAAAAVVMAVAICGMHFTGMAGTIIESAGAPPDATAGALSRPWLAVAVACATIALIGMALVSAFVDRRFDALAAREAAGLREANIRLQSEVQERLAVEAQLREAQADLERRVGERTLELGLANQRLTRAAAELDAARQRAEQEKDRAEGANRAKSDFLASMSHELRTPLNAILGYAQLLELNRKDPMTPRQERQVAQIKKSGKHLLRLIEDVLDFSKIEAGSIKLSLERVELDAVVEQVRTTLQPLADTNEIRLSAVLPPGLPAVRADRTRLVQILMNLVANACKYNRPGGSVTVSAYPVGEAACAIVVADTGLGIALDRQGEVFQPFNRLGADDSPIEGTGIGLTITKRLVQLMEGQIGFESRPGAGTTFTVTLPTEQRAEEPARAPAAEATELARRAGGYTLLYIEDNPSNIALMEELVESLPRVRLLTAGDPAKGIELARLQRPDVVVMDINLPGFNGFEALRRLQAQPETAGLPVLALSAAAMPREIERGRAAGFRHYLTKPIEVPEFLAAIEDVLGVTV